MYEYIYFLSFYLQHFVSRGFSLSCLIMTKRRSIQTSLLLLQENKTRGLVFEDQNSKRKKLFKLLKKFFLHPLLEPKHANICTFCEISFCMILYTLIFNFFFVISVSTGTVLYSPDNVKRSTFIVCSLHCLLSSKIEE